MEWATGGHHRSPKGCDSTGPGPSPTQVHSSSRARLAPVGIEVCDSKRPAESESECISPNFSIGLQCLPFLPLGMLLQH